MFNFSINERTIDINEIDELIGEINLIDIRDSLLPKLMSGEIQI